jgi:tetratricopeptide (TPR) repeat protein
MNSYSLFSSGDEKIHRYKAVLNTTFERQKLWRDERNPTADDDGYLRSSALQSAKEGNYVEAIALLNQLIRCYPDNAIDYNNRGLIYFQCGESQKAFIDYNTALQLNPKLAPAYNNRANYYAACGELQSAIEDYDRALDLNPSHVRAWINRGITLRDLGQYEEAIDNFEIALLFGQLLGNILAERGRTYHLWGDWNWAIADYRRALNHLCEHSTTKDEPASRLRRQVENWLDELLS